VGWNYKINNSARPSSFNYDPQQKDIRYTYRNQLT